MAHNTIIVYGTDWCPDCERSKRFLGKHRVRYDWVDIDRDEEGRQLVERINRGNRSVPTLVFPDGSVLVEPSDAQLAAKLGLGTEPGPRCAPLPLVAAAPG